MAKFKKGDMVVGQYFVADKSRNDMEGVIIEDYQLRELHWPDGDISVEMVYTVHWKDEIENYVREANIRRIGGPTRGDMDTKILWKDCSWSPHKDEVCA